MVWAFIFVTVVHGLRARIGIGKRADSSGVAMEIRLGTMQQSNQIKSSHKIHIVRSNADSVKLNLLRLAEKAIERAGYPWSLSRDDMIYDWKTVVKMICGKMCFESGVKERRGDRRWQWWRWWKRWSGMTKEVRLWGRDWEMWMRLVEWFRKLVPEVGCGRVRKHM